MAKNKTEKRPIAADDFYKMVYLEDPRISPDGQWIAYVQVTVDRLENTYKRNIWLAPTDGGKLYQLTRSGKDSQPRWSPDGATLAFTSARSDKPQIYLMRIGAPGGEPRQLTKFENGASTHAWSPDGTQIAFTAGLNVDERGKEGGEEDELPADKLDAKHRKERREEDEKKRFEPRWIGRIPYRAGTSFLDDRHQQVYVVPVSEDVTGDDAKPRRLTDLDANYGEVRWAADGKSLLTYHADEPDADEPFRRLKLYRINLSNGKEEELTLAEFSSFSARPSPNGKWIAYSHFPRKFAAQRLNHLTVMSVKGGKPRELTAEMDRSVNDFRWSADSRWLYFISPSEGRINIHRVSPEGGEVETVVPGLMDIEYFDLADDGSVAFVANTPTSPPELYWQPRGADEPMPLTEVNKPLLDEIIVQPTHTLDVTSPDGQKIQAWYLLPHNYEKGKKYPLAFNIHGGPAAMWSPSARTMWHEWQFHAARGYVVLYSNPRGGEGYGQDFMAAIHGKMAEPAMTDLMAVVDMLLDKGFVDEKRMAVTGGSYGGYMTGWIVGHTDRFACALAARGVYNLISMYGTTDIPEFNFDQLGVELWEDHEKLWEWSPLAYAHNIKTPLLIKHAENDYRVPIEQAEQMYATARRAGAPVRFIRYPRDGHELSRSGEPNHRLSRMNVMIDWFDQHCMSQESKKKKAQKAKSKKKK